MTLFKIDPFTGKVKEVSGEQCQNDSDGDHVLMNETHFADAGDAWAALWTECNDRYKSASNKVIRCERWLQESEDEADNALAIVRKCRHGRMAFDRSKAKAGKDQSTHA